MLSPSPHRPISAENSICYDSLTTVILGNQELFLDDDQAELLRASVENRNTAFEQTIKSISQSNLAEGDTINGFVSNLCDRAGTTFAEPSLTGMAIGKTEHDLLRAYQHSVDEVVARSGEDPLRFQFLDTVYATIKEEQESMIRHGVEPGHTQYWHFTPRIRDLARLGLLKSGADEAITNFTGSHSEGVHFVRPGLPRTPWVAAWRNYALSTHFMSNGERIPDAFGAAIVFPLARLALATPIRNEEKFVEGSVEPCTSDTTFRIIDGSAVYSYNIGDGYVMPAVSKAQMVGRESTDQTHMLRMAFMQAGYNTGWVDRHVIAGADEADEPGHIYHGEDITRAYALLTRRMQRDYDGLAAVPLSSKPGMLEPLSGSSDPRVEHLMVVKTNPAATLPAKNSPRGKAPISLSGMDFSPSELRSIF